MIVSGASRNGIEECCLSICAEPIEEEKGVLLCRSGQRIACYSLKIC